MPNLWETNSKFWISTIAGTLGLGALWRFPFAAYDENFSPASFLIIFGIQIALFVIPQYFLELSLGQYFQQSTLYIYDQPSKKWKGVVYTMFFTNFIIGIFYMYLIAYSLLYVYYSIHTNSWGFTNNESTLLHESFTFWENNILGLSEEKDSYRHISWPLLISFGSCWITMIIYLRQRIELSGTMLFLATVIPFGFLMIFSIYLILYDGFKPGLTSLIIPNFRQLTDPLLWVGVSEQVLFQMSLGTGILMQNASYQSKKSSINKPSLLVPIINSVAGLFAFIPVFDFLGEMTQKYPGDYSFLKIKKDSYGLSFVAFSAMFQRMSYPRIWTGIFFGMTALLGFTSQNCVHYYQALDLGFFGKKLTSRQTTLVVCFLFLLFGLPISAKGGSEIFDVLDNYTFFMPLCAVNFINNFLFVRNQNFQILLKNVIKMTRESVPKSFLTVTLGLAIPLFMGGILFFGFFRLMFRTLQNYNRILAIICWVFVVIMIFPILYFYLYYINSPSKNDIYTNILEEDFLQEFDLANTSKNTFVLNKRNPMMFKSDKKMKDLIELDVIYQE